MDRGNKTKNSNNSVTSGASNEEAASKVASFWLKLFRSRKHQSAAPPNVSERGVDGGKQPKFRGIADRILLDIRKNKKHGNHQQHKHSLQNDESAASGAVTRNRDVMRVSRDAEHAKQAPSAATPQRLEVVKKQLTYTHYRKLTPVKIEFEPFWQVHRKPRTTPPLARFSSDEDITSSSPVRTTRKRSKATLVRQNAQRSVSCDSLDDIIASLDDVIRVYSSCPKSPLNKSCTMPDMVENRDVTTSDQVMREQ